MIAPALRRLPGFAFETRSPVHDEVLPRMDVAVFAGFASSGPVNVPVPVEDVAAFEAVFGADVALAWDVALARTTYSRLGPAVRAFFANGGRRCWVLRLASGASTTALPVPGLAAAVGESRITELKAGIASVAPLLLQARSPGSWSDDVALSASIGTRRLAARAWTTDGYVLELAAASDAPLSAGDLLRLTWRDEGVVLYLGIASVTEQAAGRSDAHRINARAVGGAARWFRTGCSPATRTGTATSVAGQVDASLVDGPTSPPDADEFVTVELTAARERMPRVGDVVVARFDDDELLVAVRTVVLESASGSPSLCTAVVRGPGLWTWLASDAADWMPLGSPPSLPQVERLSLDLWARVGIGEPRRVGGMGLAPGHARHVEMLPSDETVYATADWPDAPRWRDVTAPRFPVAGLGEPRLCIPFGATALPERFVGPAAHEHDARTRDGLTRFDESLFSDAALFDTRAAALLTDAEYLRFFAPRTRELTGVHRALGIEEATLIAVPDAIQPGWMQGDRGEPLPAVDTSATESEGEPDGWFETCAPPQGAAPVIAATADDAAGTVRLEITAESRAGPFVVQEASSRDWRDAATFPADASTDRTIGPRRPGDYYYRVRGIGARPTAWSRGAAIRLTPGGGWRTVAPERYDDRVLLAVHRTLLRLCAARRDIMAVLSLPEHYRESAAAAHVRLLEAAPDPLGRDAADVVPALGAGEADALGFGALYHGWIHSRADGGALRVLPPDGPACGAIARRANERGAWIAPANELLRGVVALERPAAADRWLELQQLGINVVRQHPRGFIVLSADTLSRDGDVRPIGVRRLLMLLRRIATRRGATYVFEPNDDSFRRMVQRGFEATLGDLFQRGAFAGTFEDEAFRVVTDPTLNTRQSADLGRFIVELRVAPSRPMTFLTLRLVQTGERVAVTGA